MKKASISQYLYLFYSFIFILHMVNVFVDSERLNYILGILAIIALCVSISGASKLFKVLSGSFLFVGGALFLTTDHSVWDIPSLLTANLSILTLLAMLPWMNSVVRSGRFDQILHTVLEANVADLGKLYPRSSVTTFTLAAFLNLSAASIAQDVLKNSLARFDKSIRDSFIRTATLRGFSLALLWSPLEVLLAVSIFTTGVEYTAVLPWLLLIALLTFLIDAVWGRLHYRKYPFLQNGERGKSQYTAMGLVKRIAHLLVALVIFLTLVITIGNGLQLDFIFTVTILIFPFAYIWALVMKRSRSFWRIGWPTWKQKTNTMQNFIVLFISLSFFASSANGSSLLESIQKPILAIADYPLLILIFIQVLFIFMSMFGVHPVATIGLISGVMSTLLGIINPISLAIVLITGSVATITVGTYGLVVTLTSLNTEQSPYKITLSNLPYALLFGGLGTTVAYFLL